MILKTKNCWNRLKINASNLILNLKKRIKLNTALMLSAIQANSCKPVFYFFVFLFFNVFCCFFPIAFFFSGSFVFFALFFFCVAFLFAKKKTLFFLLFSKWLNRFFFFFAFFKKQMRFTELAWTVHHNTAPCKMHQNWFWILQKWLKLNIEPNSMFQGDMLATSSDGTCVIVHTGASRRQLTMLPSLQQSLTSNPSPILLHWSCSHANCHEILYLLWCPGIV